MNKNENTRNVGEMLVKVSEVTKPNQPKSAVSGQGSSKSKVPMWDDQRLYPPSEKCVSRVWNFGGMKKDKMTGQLLLGETICGFYGCKKKYRNIDQKFIKVFSIVAVVIKLFPHIIVSSPYFTLSWLDKGMQPMHIV